MLQSVIFFDSIGFFIIIYNVLNYLFIFYFLFFIFYLIDLKNLNLNSQLFVFEKSNFLTLNFIFIFLSFAGIPPFLGFFSKFIIAGFLIVKSNFFYFFIFLFFNFFVIYFYIQNFKYINTSLCRFQESYPLQINNFWLF
jgi:NADH:ubiquinone oxidoreductase subunit 2 (subunit N)